MRVAVVSQKQKRRRTPGTRSSKRSHEPHSHLHFRIFSHCERGKKGYDLQEEAAKRTESVWPDKARFATRSSCKLRQ